MIVTNVRVSFFREKQPAQYEKAQPMVELAAVLTDGENHLVAARQLMFDAATVVYAGLGYGVPEKVAAALAVDETPTDITVNIKYAKANEPAQTGAEVLAEAADKIGEAIIAETVDETAEKAEPKKRRGRKPGSKNLRPRKGTPEADAHLAKADEIPGETPSDLSSGDARIGPDDDPADHGVDDVPGEAAPAKQEPEVADKPVEQAFTALDLHKYMSEAARDGKITVQAAKAQVLHAQGVARAQDLTDEQVIKGRKIIDLMIEAGANK